MRVCCLACSRLCWRRAAPASSCLVAKPARVPARSARLLSMVGASMTWHCRPTGLVLRWPVMMAHCVCLTWQQEQWWAASRSDFYLKQIAGQARCIVSFSYIPPFWMMMHSVHNLFYVWTPLLFYQAVGIAASHIRTRTTLHCCTTAELLRSDDHLQFQP